MQTIHNQIKEMAGWDDRRWYLNVLSNHPGSCHLTEKEETEILLCSMQAAEQYAIKLKKRYGNISGVSLASQMGLTITGVQEELREPFLYMGMFEPKKNVILLNDTALNAVKVCIKEYQLDELLCPSRLEELVLFHEIFHWLEEHTPGIYTRSNMLNRPLFHIIPHQRGLDAAGEIGAIHFSKKMTETTVSPCLYEVCLLIKAGICSIDFFSNIL